MIPEPRTNHAILADKACMVGCIAVYGSFQALKGLTAFFFWALNR